MAQTLSVTDIAARAKAHRPAFNVPWRPALMRYASQFAQAAGQTQYVDACMLAAIVARESGGQNILQIGIAPGPGCGVGLCQITSGVDWSILSAPTYPGFGPLLDPDINILVAGKAFLDPLLNEFSSNHIAAFAAYNVGPSAVQSALRQGLSPDAWTTNHDYGTDVFTSWINFAAASMGYNVDWANHGTAATSSANIPTVTGSTPAAPKQTVPTAQNPASDLSDD